MAHRLLETDLPTETHKKKWYHFTFPQMEGRFGFSLSVGSKEYFIGVSVNDVVKEQVIRKRTLAPTQGTAKVYTPEE